MKQNPYLLLCLAVFSIPNALRGDASRMPTAQIQQGTPCGNRLLPSGCDGAAKRFLTCSTALPAAYPSRTTKNAMIGSIRIPFMLSLRCHLGGRAEIVNIARRSARLGHSTAMFAGAGLGRCDGAVPLQLPALPLDRRARAVCA